jgi:hypothetical protein
MSDKKKLVPEQCPNCGATDKKDKKNGCCYFWHDLVDSLGNAIGEAKFGE